MKKSQQPVIDRLPFYFLAALILLLPLLFSTSVDNGYDLVKSAYFRTVSALFILISLIVLRKRFISSKSFLIINKPLDAGIVLFIFAAVLSTIFSINPGVSLYGQYMRQIGLLTYLALFIIYFVLSFQLFNKKEIDNILLVMEITAAVVSVYSILQYFGLDPFKIQITPFKRPISTLGSSVFAAGLMTLILPFPVIRILQKKITLLYLAVPVLILFGIIISQTRTVYTALLIQLVLFSLLYPHLFKIEKEKFRKISLTGIIIIAAIALVLILSVFIFPQNVFIQRFTSIAALTETQRWTLWQSIFNIIKKYPLTGSGISTFSRAIEDFITVALKDKEAAGYYDNAHNNFLHIFSTMGIAGLAGYLLILYSGIKQSFTNLFNNALSQSNRMIFLAYICALAGYITYGMADFDDLSILTYLFILLALLKLILYSSGAGEAIELKKTKQLTLKNFASAIIILFLFLCVYNIYSSYTELKADKLARIGKQSFSETDIRVFSNYMSEAINTKPYPEYRFTFAYYYYLFTFDNPYLKPEEKISLLNYAERQVDTAIADHPSSLECKSLISLIKYEAGDTVNAERIKNEVLEKDPLLTEFRINLARYYFKSWQETKALEELKIVYKYDPHNVDAYFTSIIYLIQKKEYVYAENCCNAILNLQPGNQMALYYLNEIKKLKQKN